MTVPASIVSFAVEDAILAYLRASGVSLPCYGTADGASAAMLDNRVEVLAGDVEPEFADAPPDTDAAANMVVPVAVTVQTNVAPSTSGGVDVETARTKHIKALAHVQDCLMVSDLPAQLMAQNIDGLHVGYATWAGTGRPDVAGGKYRTALNWQIHACGK